MEFKKFEEIIDLLIFNDKRIDNIYNEGIDLINFQDELYRVINILFIEIFGKEGEELIGWWLYDNVDKKIIVNNKEYNVEKINDFYTFLIDYLDKR